MDTLEVENYRRARCLNEAVSLGQSKIDAVFPPASNLPPDLLPKFVNAVGQFVVIAAMAGRVQVVHIIGAAQVLRLDVVNLHLLLGDFDTAVRAVTIELLMHC